MSINKYKNMFLKKLNRQFTAWFESDEDKPIPNSDVYSFLHSAKGTSGTLELWEIHKASVTLLEQVKDADDKNWAKNEIKQFLNELINLTGKYEHFDEEEASMSERFPDENKPLIQVIGDDVSNLINIRDYLEEKGWMVISNSPSEKAVSQFLDLTPDCVIIDVNFPDENVFKIIRALQQYSNNQFVPIIMISILKDKNTRMRAFNDGVDDFLEKPADLEELVVHINRHLQRKKLFVQSSLLDELTKLYNRKYLKVAFNRFLNDLKRNGQPFCIAMIDLDFFKRINDSYGHQIGDMVLSKFAAYLADSTRNNDLVFRYGGEEFTILLQNIDDIQATKIIQRVLNNFSKQHFEANGQEFSLTFSTGIYMIKNPESTMEVALNIADQALYKAKESGRARVECIHIPESSLENRKLFISVIDDVAVIRMMLLRDLLMLKIDHYDIHVQVFQDGPSFFRSNRLKQHGTHFLILDGILPEMDGLEILEKVKHDYGSSVLVMMLTGRNSKADIAKALELGADDYMTKPFNIENLNSRIKHLINRIKK